MKCAPNAAAISSSAATGLSVQRHANSASNAVVTAATITPNPAMNKAPRSDAISGSTASARHSGQLANSAIHDATSTATLNGFKARRFEVGRAGMGLYSARGPADGFRFESGNQTLLWSRGQGAVA